MKQKFSFYLFTQVKWKKLLQNFYSSFIHNFLKLETTQMSINWECISKLWYMLTMEYYLLSNKNKLFICAIRGMNLECITLSKKARCKRWHTTWFHLYSILRKAKLWEWRTYPWLLGVSGDDTIWLPRCSVREFF